MAETATTKSIYAMDIPELEAESERLQTQTDNRNREMQAAMQAYERAVHEERVCRKLLSARLNMEATACTE